MVEKNIFEGIQFHLEGLEKENFPIPDTTAESGIVEYTI